MTNTRIYRRIAIVSAVVVGAVALAYGGFVAWMYHITYASAADCGAAQAVVRGADRVTDAAAAKAWAATARVQKDKIGHERLRTGVTEYIAVVERTFNGPPPKAEARGDAFSDMFDACRDIHVN